MPPFAFSQHGLELVRGEACPALGIVYRRVLRPGRRVSNNYLRTGRRGRSQNRPFLTRAEAASKLLILADENAPFLAPFLIRRLPDYRTLTASAAWRCGRNRPRPHPPRTDAGRQRGRRDPCVSLKIAPRWAILNCVGVRTENAISRWHEQ